MKTDVLIIGAGISGLSCASKLNGRDYLILEKESEVGGYCRTTLQNGFVWDYAGHFFHFSNQEIKNEFSDLLSENDIVFNKKCTKIYYKGEYIDYPFQFNIHQLPKDEFIECLVGLFSKNDRVSSTFKDMLYEKYGEGISDKFLIPYNTKLYACDLNSLDKMAMGRFFPQANPEEIIKGFKSEQKRTYNDTFYYSKKGAVAFVSKVLEKVDKDRILTDTTAVSINCIEKYVETVSDRIYYNKLICTLPFDEFLSISGTESHATYSSNKVLVFNLGFDSNSDRNDIQWVYYPGDETCFYRVGFYNNILHTDKMSLYVEIGLQDCQNVDIDKMLERVIDDLKNVGVIKTQKLIEKQYIIMNPAYVHINHEASEEKDRIIQELRKKDVYFVGRYGMWTYCSIEDCIIQANDVVEILKQ